jgi:REP element-mobilizing transposase RayT
MPNHIHLLLTLSENESATKFQRDFLKFTSQELIRLLLGNGQQEELNKYLSTQNDRIYHVWERRPKWIKIDNTIILFGWLVANTKPQEEK